MSKISELSDGGVVQGGDTLIAVRSGGNVKVTYGGSTTANIDGGTIDDTVIGGTTAAAGTFTTGQFDTSVNVDGTVTADGLTVANAAPFAAQASFVQTASTGGVSFIKVQSNTSAIDLMSGGGTFAVNYMGANESGLVTQGADGMRFNVGGSYARWTFGATERLRINSSGNVGIGTSSPAQKLDVAGGVNSTGLNVTGNGGFFNAANKFGVDNNGGVTRMYSSGPNTSTRGAYDFRATDSVGTLDTSRMIIDSSGNLLVGTTSLPSAGSGGVGFQPTTASRTIIRCSTSVTTSAGLVIFQNPNGEVGSISTNGSATSYNTSSDERLKENITDAPAGNIDDIKVRSFDWKANGSHQEYGMVAQELEAVAPYAVTKGASEDDMWSVDYSKLVPMLIKEIQDLKAEVAALKGAN